NRAGAGLQRVRKLHGDVGDVLGGQAEVLRVLFDLIGEEVIARETDVLAADEQVGQTDQQDHVDVDQAGGLESAGAGDAGAAAAVGGQRRCAVEPDRLGDDLREVPGFGEAFAGKRVVEADDAAFDIGDIAAGEVGHLDDAGETFGHGGVEGDLTNVVE